MSEHEPKNVSAVPTELITPASQAYMNAAIAAAVQEAVKGVFAGLQPMIEAISLTPEKLRDAQKPYVDPAHIARELRERANMKEQDLEARRNVELRQKNCTHQDKNGRWAISPVHNFPDHNARGICPLCHLWITPKQWVIDSPTLECPKGYAHIVPEHALYFVVRQIETLS